MENFNRKMLIEENGMTIENNKTSRILKYNYKPGDSNNKKKLRN